MIRGRPWRRYISDPVIAALLLIFFAIASRVAFFAIIDATSWPVAYERFLFPVMPMASVFLLTLSLHAANRLLRRQNPAAGDAAELTV